MASPITFRFLFEQSGTFKRCAQEMGFTAFDYDILDDWGETDYPVDLFEEIEHAFKGFPSIFDEFGKDDVVMAFFPCIRFCRDFQMRLAGNQFQLKDKSLLDKLDVSMEAHDQLNWYYWLLCNLCSICLQRGIRLVIENPFTDNYLLKYFPIKPAIVYQNRRKFGDYYSKPTMFLFVGWKPFDNPVFECFDNHPNTTVQCKSGAERSLMSPCFSRYFILSHLVDLDTAMEVLNRD